MSQQPHVLEYATPQPRRSRGWGRIIIGFGLLAVVAGIITSFAATAGVDNRGQILIGAAISAFGVICAIQGLILHTLENR